MESEFLDQLRQILASKGAGPIFNGTRYLGFTADKRRLQANVGQNPMVQTFLRMLEKTICERLPKFTRNLTFNDWVVLQSLPGCQEQPPHTDFVPTQDLIQATTASEETTRGMPLLCLVATMPNTYFDVWPESIHLIQSDIMQMETASRIQPGFPAIQRQRLTLDAGDILIFRPDLIHAGAAFDEENIRLHAFMDSVNVRRTRNRTWIIHKNGSDELKLRIVI